MSCSVGLTNFEYVVGPAAQPTNPLVQCTVHYAVARILPTSHHFPNSGLERSASSGVGRDGATPPSTRSIAAHPLDVDLCSVRETAYSPMAMLRRQRVRPPEEDRDRLLAGITGSVGGRGCGSFRRQREAENVLRAQRELADGHASYRFSASLGEQGVEGALVRRNFERLAELARHAHQRPFPSRNRPILRAHSSTE